MKHPFYVFESIRRMHCWDRDSPLCTSCGAMYVCGDHSFNDYSVNRIDSVLRAKEKFENERRQRQRPKN